MYIQRALLLLIFIVVVFLPSSIQWAMDSPSAWYRPHLLWLAMIVLIYLGQRRVRNIER